MKTIRRSWPFLVAMVLFTLIDESKASPNLQSYDALSAMAQRNGYGQLANAISFVRAYRLNLEECKQNGKSNVELADYMDRVIASVNTKLGSRSIRSSSFRNQVANELTYSAVLLEKYCFAKAERFGENEIDKTDLQLVQTVYWMNNEIATLMRLSRRDLGSARAYWNDQTMKKYERDPVWGSGIGAIQRLPNDEEVCRIAI